jgi:hypothetical protein
LYILARKLVPPKETTGPPVVDAPNPGHEGETGGGKAVWVGVAVEVAVTVEVAVGVAVRVGPPGVKLGVGVSRMPQIATKA